MIYDHGYAFDNYAVKGFTKGSMPARQRIRYHQQMERIRLTHQRGMRSNLKRIFRAQEDAILSLDEITMNDVADILIRSVPAFDKVYEVTYAGIADDVYPMLVSDADAKALWERWATKGREEEETAYGVAIREWIRRECGEKIVAINQTTLDQVKRIYESTANQIEFREAIAHLFDDSITPYRSNAIARTETACATNRASVETMDALGFEGRKTWLAVGDQDTRDTHMHVDGMTVDFDGYFEWDRPDGIHVKMECPLDGTWAPPASEVVNCRCDVGFEL